MWKFVEHFAWKSGSYLHPQREITEFLVIGLAKHIDEGRRGLAICAADGNDMAPELATNLAVSLAQASLRTLLIDCDLEGGIRPDELG